MYASIRFHCKDCLSVLGVETQGGVKIYVCTRWGCSLQGIQFENPIQTEVHVPALRFIA